MRPTCHSSIAERQPERTRRVRPSDGTASGAAERRAPGGRNFGDVVRSAGHNGDIRPDGSAGDDIEARRADRFEDAARQVCEHLALDAVVVGRMGRASRNVREIARLVLRVVARRMGAMIVRRDADLRVAAVVPMYPGVRTRCDLERDRWQDPGRRPNERDQRAPRDPRPRPGDPDPHGSLAMRLRIHGARCPGLSRSEVASRIALCRAGRRIDAGQRSCARRSRIMALVHKSIEE